MAACVSRRDAFIGFCSVALFSLLAWTPFNKQNINTIKMETKHFMEIDHAEHFI